MKRGKNKEASSSSNDGDESISSDSDHGDEISGKRRKNAYKSFSGRNWDEICKLLSIVRVVHGDIIPNVAIGDLSNIIGDVLSAWNKRSLLLEFPGHNESESEDYVMDVLLSVVPHGERLAIRKRYPVKSEEYGGPVDIAVYALTPSKMPVVYVVEAKKRDVDQGRAQLYPQLKLCYELAKREEEWENPIYGAISTVKEWVFVRYDGKKWLESQPLAITTAHDQTGVERVVEVLYKIIHHQNSLVENVVKKYATAEEENE
jgi:hypothetical protein